MAEIRSAEGHKIVQRLLKELEESKTLESTTSTNTLKKIRRGLGALLFSPDSLGYIDIIENGLAANKTPTQILRSVMGRSEKLVKSYSPLPGVFEAHHVIALSSMRDSFMGLPPAEQDKFLKQLADAGWELGDSPQQLVNTVLTRMSHVGQKAKSTELSKVKPGKIHAHSAKSVATPAGTADDLFNQFKTRIAPESVGLAQDALVQDAAFRAFMETKGFRVDEITPQLVNEYLNDPIKTRNLMGSLNEAVTAYETVDRPTTDAILTSTGVKGQATPETIPKTSRILRAVGLQGLGEIDTRQAQRIMQGLISNPIVGQTPAGRVVRGAVAGAGLYGDIAQAKEGFTAATTQTNRLRQTAGQLDVLAGGMGLTGLSLPAAVIPGLMAQHLRNRADVQQEAADEVAAIEGTKPAPVLDFIPEIVPTENLGGTERRRRRRDAERAEAAAVN